MKSYKVIDLLEEVISGEWGQEPDGENDVKVLRTTNFTNEGRLDLSKEIVTRSIEKKKVEKKKLQYGDIIIEKSGGSPDQPVGRVVYFDIEDNDIYLCNNFTSILRPNSKKVENKYLLYFLYYQHKIRKVLKYQNKTTGIINLKLDNYLNKTDIVLPPRKIQQRVVELLDKSYELIEKRKSQIKALDQLTQSVFLEMFGDPVTNPKGWDVCTFKDVSTVRQGLQIPISKRLKHKVENSYKYITVQYLNGHKEEEYIQNPKPNVICTKDDILMTRTGNTGMVISNVEGVFHNNFFLIDFNRELFEKMFLIYYLNTEYIQWDLLRRAGNSTIPDLNHSEFYKISVYVPPLELQKIFANKIKRIEHQKELLKSGLLELENMYNALMQKAFKGELFTEEKVSNL